jgi:hypothetical protein
VLTALPCPQDHGTILPMLLAGKTAQPAALTPLCVISEGLEQLEKLAAANLKGGVFQGLCASGWGWGRVAVSGHC